MQGFKKRTLRNIIKPMLQELKQKDINNIEQTLKVLAVQKLWKINVQGNKVKVFRKSVNEYEIYHDGHYVTSDNDWKQAFDLTIELLKAKK
jgi:hypothetical protein